MAILLDGTVGITTPSLTNTGVETISGVTTIQGITVGKGGGAVSTNTAVGASALAANTSGVANTAMGAVVMSSNTTGGYNSAFGRNALNTNTTGSNNTAIGYNSLVLGTTGGKNTAVGDSALFSNTTADNNTAVGYQAAYNNTTGTQNTAIGYQAGYSNSTSNYNAIFGNQAGYSTTGGFNTFLGSGAGYYVSSGTKNTIIGGYTGNQGGLDIRTASNYIVLSDGDGNPRLISDGSGNIGINTTSPDSGAKVTIQGVSGANGMAVKAGTNGNYGIYFNNVANSTVGGIIINSGSVAYNTTSDYRLKENVQPMVGALATVAQLKPCTYTWKATGETAQGFIAHELQAVIPDAVSGEKDAVNEDGSIKAQGIDTSFLVATLTAAIQELKAEFDAYKATHP